MVCDDCLSKSWVSGFRCQGTEVIDPDTLYETTVKANRRSYKEKLEYEKLPAQIDGLESDLAQACDLLADPKIYKAAPDKVHKLTALSKDLPKQIEQLYARWEELDAMVE